MNQNSSSDRKFRPLFWIPVIWNGFTLLVGLIVGLTFLWGSFQPADAQVALPDILLSCFTLFDFLLIISPVTIIVMVLLSVFNVIRESSKMRRFLPLTLSAVTQGAMTALFLTSITRPVP